MNFISNQKTINQLAILNSLKDLDIEKSDISSGSLTLILYLNRLFTLSNIKTLMQINKQ